MDLLAGGSRTTIKDSALQHLIVVPPDGGWGWVVLIAAFLQNLITDGIVYTFGLFLDDLSASYGVTVGSVTMVGSTISCFYYLVGPFVSALINRFGFRVVAIMGSVVAGSCFALGTICTKFWLFALTAGVLAGVGLGMCTVPAVIIVGFYFEKWRALATGIATCGSGMGTLVMPPLIIFMLERYDWRKTYLVLSGMIFLNGVIAILYRPLLPVKVVKPEEELRTIQSADSKTSFEEETTKCCSCNFRRHHNIRYPTTAEIVPIETVILEKPERAADFIESTSTLDSDTYLPIKHSQQLSRASIPPAAGPRCPCCARTCGPCWRRFVKFVCCGHCQTVSRPMYRDDIFFGHSLMLLPQYKDSLSAKPRQTRRHVPDSATSSRALPLRRSTGYHMSVTRVTTYRDIYGETDEQVRCGCHLAVLRTLSTMLDFRMLKSPAFLMFSWSGMFIAFGYLVPYLYISDRAVASGADPELAFWLLSAIGASNTFGRIFCGVLPSVTGVKVIEYSYVSIAIAGIMTAVSGFWMRMEFQFIYACMYGMLGSCIATLRPVIVVELFGLEHLTNAFGLQLTFMSVAVLSGTSFAGLMYDITNNFNTAFYVSGGSLLISAVLLMFTRPMREYEKRRNIFA